MECTPTRGTNERKNKICQRRNTYINISDSARTEDRGATGSNGLEDARSNEGAGRFGKATTKGGQTKDGGENQVEDTAELEVVRQGRGQQGGDAHEQDKEGDRRVDGGGRGIEILGDLDQGRELVKKKAVVMNENLYICNMKIMKEMEISISLAFLNLHRWWS